MSVSPPPAADRTPVSAANEAIRHFVRERAGGAWTRAELAELDRLRRAWRRARSADQNGPGPGA
ncbi:hypothetical protein QMK19_06960 [Streptomyces sp. H10-C2]|uniref:hypothetical protein n=1 Tax=unclassified Streptomyces TaxID=2593676 RepID=UPI0024B8F065|nr:MULTISPECIES: hypothetical protein [unclassified Streptomyces]MDJ0341227.1 hypothetical protein [Streptomyces sp. PH10-H1]MDJ0369420.1 hypothetical protein [Streptomyces sp. H10-C2]